ncbi:Hepatocellular carcinoma-associated antigen 59 family protein [Aphelenchoides avenae]|nr:Hepatocellular carcinoma-associated antigen 59 family protein [Aphelenchus avenae]
MFRKPRKKPIASRRVEETEEVNMDEDDEEVTSKVQDIREAQKVRERRNGMTAVECAVGKEMAREFNEFECDPFRMKGGGMLQLSEDRKAALFAADIEHDIKEQFKKETLLRDENEEMRKYIDARLNGQSSSATDDDGASAAKKFKPTNAEDLILLKAAEKLKGYSSKRNDELLSNEMLNGIPEVDLGIDVRINNIVETERKKAELMQKQTPGGGTQNASTKKPSHSGGARLFH